MCLTAAIKANYSQAQNNGTKNIIKYKVYKDKRHISEETTKKKHSEIYNMNPT
jgi:hypothetical protein